MNNEQYELSIIYCYYIETLTWYRDNLWMIKKVAKKYYKTI